MPLDPISWDEFCSRLPDPPPGPPPTRKPTVPAGRPADAMRQAKQWLDACGPAIEGKDGSGHTFGVAVGLVKGFMLRPYEALELLRGWNQRCEPPWSEYDLRRKVEEAERAPDREPPGYHLRRPPTLQPPDWTGIEAQDEPADAPEAADAAPPPPGPDGPAAPAPAREGKRVTIGEIMENPECLTTDKASTIYYDPAYMANTFAEKFTPTAEQVGYRWWGGQFWLWDKSIYTAVPDEEFEGLLFIHCDSILYDQYLEQYDAQPDPDKREKIKKRMVNAGMIKMVRMALIGLLAIKTDATSAPFWIRRPEKGWDAADVIPFANRLVHMPSFVAGEAGSWTRKTPNLFSTNSLAYPFHFDFYTGPVPPPDHWRGYLESQWDDDEESILTTREMMGYLFTSSNKYQKLFMLIGPPRSGKGTLVGVIRDLLGQNNVASATFNGLSKDFGCEILIDKNVAIFPDARITGRTDVGGVAENIVSITGGDHVYVNRKHKKAISRLLNCRFLILSNLLPRLTDQGGALHTRAIILRFTRSFYGKEDLSLAAKIQKELPAIARWAIDGWASLTARGHFIQPASGRELVEDLRNLATPIQHFAEDCLQVGPEYEADSASVFSLYKEWCFAKNKEHVGDLTKFESDLKAAISPIRYGGAARIDGSGRAWSRVIRGLRIRPDLAADPHANGHAASYFANVLQEGTP